MGGGQLQTEVKWMVFLGNTWLVEVKWSHARALARLGSCCFRKTMGKQVRYFQRREREASASSGGVATSSPAGSTAVADLQISPSQLFTQLWPPFCHKPLLLKQQKSFCACAAEQLATAMLISLTDQS